MAQNNFQHYSDLAEYTKFLPAGTQWPTNITNVQAALALIGPWARTDKGLPVATNTVQGIAAIATQTEVNAGTINNKFVTPATLNSAITRPDASETVKGLTMYAKNDEAKAGAINNKAIVPTALKYVLDNRPGSESVLGLLKLATAAMGQAATDNTTACSPKRVYDMIMYHTPSDPPTYTAATETKAGIVTIATQAQVAAGTAHDGYAVTPKTFIGTKASEGAFGVTRYATQNEVNGGTVADRAVTPKTLNGLRGSTTQYGLLQLSGTSQGGQTAARADSVVFKTRKVNNKALDNDIFLGAGDVDAWSKGEADGRFMPKSQLIGNVTRVATVRRGKEEIWKEWVTDSPWEAGSHAGISVSIKFERNNDGGDNRVAWFDLYVAGNFRQRIQLNIENTKGGRNGHSWRFEGFANCFEGFDTAAKENVILKPAGGFERVNEWSAQIIYCTNNVQP